MHCKVPFHTLRLQPRWRTVSQDGARGEGSLERVISGCGGGHKAPFFARKKSLKPAFRQA